MLCDHYCRAAREVWPETREQACWCHKLSNVLDKLPQRLQPRAKRALHEMMYAECRADCEAARARATPAGARVIHQPQPPPVLRNNKDHMDTTCDLSLLITDCARAGRVSGGVSTTSYGPEILGGLAHRRLQRPKPIELHQDSHPGRYRVCAGSQPDVPFASLAMCALSGAGGACPSPLHARSLRTSPEDASNLRLYGGEGAIRTVVYGPSPCRKPSVD